MSMQGPGESLHGDFLRRGGRRRLLLGGAALAGAALSRAVQCATDARERPTESKVEVERRGDTVAVQAQADASATLGQAYATLVDYDRLADFIPDMAASHTLARSGLRALIEQRARAGLGPFRQTFRLVLAVEEVPNVAIRASAAGGDFKRFDASYELSSIDAHRTHIAYHALLEPITSLPALFGEAIVRDLVQRQFNAMVEEITRRGARS
jgi:ribosome-associated toxin RatA of RatAB toxin-antitoxin module